MSQTTNQLEMPRTDPDACCICGLSTTVGGYIYGACNECARRAIGAFAGLRRDAVTAPALLKALKDQDLRATQAMLASSIGNRKNQTAFLLGELGRMREAARAAIARFLARE